MEYNKFHPAPEFILVKPEKAQSKSSGGIIIAEEEQETLYQGTVIAKGEGAEVSYHIGSTVVYGKYNAGEKIKLNGEEFLIVKSKEILGRLVVGE